MDFETQTHTILEALDLAHRWQVHYVAGTQGMKRFLAEKDAQMFLFGGCKDTTIRIDGGWVLEISKSIEIWENTAVYRGIS